MKTVALVNTVPSLMSGESNTQRYFPVSRSTHDMSHSAVGSGAALALAATSPLEADSALATAGRIDESAMAPPAPIAKSERNPRRLTSRGRFGSVMGRP